ncbi:hypothetical protein V8F44DRAFT_616187 [Aspergillus fumigatus]|jgi:hypothetical protein
MDTIGDKLSKEPDLAKTGLEIDYIDPTQICRTPIPETASPTRYSSTLDATLMLH